MIICGSPYHDGHAPVDWGETLPAADFAAAWAALVEQGSVDMLCGALQIAGSVTLSANGRRMAACSIGATSTGAASATGDRAILTEIARRIGGALAEIASPAQSSPAKSSPTNPRRRISRRTVWSWSRICARCCATHDDAGRILDYEDLIGPARGPCGTAGAVVMIDSYAQVFWSFSRTARPRPSRT